jgi:hypothetical protein
VASLISDWAPARDSVRKFSLHSYGVGVRLYNEPAGHAILGGAGSREVSYAALPTARFGETCSTLFARSSGPLQHALVVLDYLS